MTNYELLPAELRQVFESVDSEVIWLHGKWITYCQLYGTSKERIDILNATAVSFFRIVQEVLLDSVVLTFSRLTDPAKTLGKDNRSLEQLIAILNDSGYSALASLLRDKFDRLKNQCEAFRVWRNRKIAHSDLCTALEVHPVPLPGFSMQSVEDALETMRDFMNTINLYFSGSSIVYEHFVMKADANVLVAILGEANARRGGKWVD